MKHLHAAAFLSLQFCSYAATAGDGAHPVRPQADLYHAANGAWLAATAIPPERAEVYGADLPAAMNARLRSLVTSLAATPEAADGPARKIADYYASYMDTAAIDRAGLAPMRATMASIDAISTPAQLAQWQGSAQGIWKTPIWMWGGFADFKDPGRYRALAMQGGLGMPDRDYYLKPGEPRLEQARAAYLAYLTRLAALAGLAAPGKVAAQVLALETRIAQAHLPADQAMDPARVVALSASELMARAPGFDWAAFLAAARLDPKETVNVVQIGAAIAIARIHAETPIAHWKHYLKLRSLDAAGAVLPSAFRDARFAFHGKALAGQLAASPRDERAIDEVAQALGDGLAQLYMQRHFPAAHKARAEKLVNAILAEARKSVASIAWMGEATRAEARAKLASCKARVGYPAVWRDYTALRVERGDAAGNWMRARRFEWERLAAQSGTPVDRAMWLMSPLEPNAYYDPVQNEINIPAGILQAPFFDHAASDAENYGGIGALVAHEISHAFDTMGSQFDSRGMQRDWWNGEDRQAFARFSERMVRQFDAYEALPGQRVNGKLTLSENIADLMGLQLAYRAYRANAADAGPSPDGDRRFFHAYARQFAVKRRDERQQQLLSSDPHAPAQFRTNGPVRHVDGFHAAFGTQPGDAMYVSPADRLKSW